MDLHRLCIKLAVLLEQGLLDHGLLECHELAVVHVVTLAQRAVEPAFPRGVVDVWVCEPLATLLRFRFVCGPRKGCALRLQSE